MKLTPWMLTVATFVMVAAIAVLYFFKGTQGPAPAGSSVAQNSQLHAGQQAAPSWTVFPDETEDTPSDSETPENAQTQQSTVEPQPGTGQPDDATHPDDVATTDPDRPIDPLFQDPPMSPDTDVFVTEQYRSIERTEVSFANGRRRQGPRVSDATKPAAEHTRTRN